MNNCDIERPVQAISDALAEIGSATASSELSLIGLCYRHIRGSVAKKEGYAVAGPALTLEFMSRREDLSEGGEYPNPELQLHRHMMHPAKAGDMIVVDARGNMDSSIFGELMFLFLADSGGKGVVVDGCICDTDTASEIDLGIWARGSPPNFHAQTNIIPDGVKVPMACGGTFVRTGDRIIADDDGAVAVPVALALNLHSARGEHAELEEFSHLRRSRGSDLQTYYPLSPKAEGEYVSWRDQQNGRA